MEVFVLPKKIFGNMIHILKSLIEIRSTGYQPVLQLKTGELSHRLLICATGIFAFVFWAQIANLCYDGN